MEYESVRDFVDKNVYSNITDLIDYLSKDEDCRYYHQIRAQLLDRIDHKSSLDQTIYEIAEDEYGEYFWLESGEPDTASDQTFDTEEEAIEGCCLFNCIELRRIEAYEHWSISQDLASRLADKDQMISLDIFGLAVWGRAGTGQAIRMDPVIKEIYEGLRP